MEEVINHIHKETSLLTEACIHLRPSKTTQTHTQIGTTHTHIDTYTDRHNTHIDTTQTCTYVNTTQTNT